MSESDAALDAVSCEDATVWIAHRLASRPSSIEDGPVRSHLARCGECRSAYRSQMADLAHFSRAALQSTSGDSAPIGAGILRPRLSRKHRGLLLLIAISATIFAVSRVGNGLRADPTLPVEWVHGEFWVAGEPVGADFGPRMGLRGDLVQTGADGRARLRFDEGHLEIGSSTTLVVETAVGERVRLVGGEVQLVGAAALGTPFGLVELGSGACAVELHGERLHIESRRGTTVFVNAHGARQIPQGTAFTWEGGPVSVTIDAPAAISAPGS